MNATVADRYDRAASSLRLALGAFLADDPASAQAGALMACGLLWGTPHQVVLASASRIYRELQAGQPGEDLADRIGSLRDHLTTEAALTRVKAPEPPEALIVAESLDPHDADDLGCPFLLCPYDDCLESGEIRQVEKIERWNTVEYHPSTGGIRISDGTGCDDAEDCGFLCAACQRPVTLPETIAANRSWS